MMAKKSKIETKIETKSLLNEVTGTSKEKTAARGFFFIMVPADPALFFGLKEDYKLEITRHDVRTVEDKMYMALSFNNQNAISPTLHEILVESNNFTEEECLIVKVSTYKLAQQFCRSVPGWKHKENIVSQGKPLSAIELERQKCREALTLVDYDIEVLYKNHKPLVEKNAVYLDSYLSMVERSSWLY